MAGGCLGKHYAEKQELSTTHTGVLRKSDINLETFLALPTEPDLTTTYIARSTTSTCQAVILTTSNGNMWLSRWHWRTPTITFTHQALFCFVSYVLYRSCCVNDTELLARYVDPTLLSLAFLATCLLFDKASIPSSKSLLAGRRSNCLRSV